MSQDRYAGGFGAVLGPRRGWDTGPLCRVGASSLAAIGRARLALDEGDPDPALRLVTALGRAPGASPAVPSEKGRALVLSLARHHVEAVAPQECLPGTAREVLTSLLGPSAPALDEGAILAAASEALARDLIFAPRSARLMAHALAPVRLTSATCEGMASAVLGEGPGWLQESLRRSSCWPAAAAQMTFPPAGLLAGEDVLPAVTGRLMETVLIESEALCAEGRGGDVVFALGDEGCVLPVFALACLAAMHGECYVRPASLKLP